MVFRSYRKRASTTSNAIALPTSPGAPRNHHLTTHVERPSLDGSTTRAPGSFSWDLPTRWCLCNLKSSALRYSALSSSSGSQGSRGRGNSEPRKHAATRGGPVRACSTDRDGATGDATRTFHDAFLAALAHSLREAGIKFKGGGRSNGSCKHIFSHLMYAFVGVDESALQKLNGIIAD